MLSCIKKYIITTNILLYETVYNDNKYCHYKRRCIMTTNISLIHESIYFIIRSIYNDTKISLSHKNVYRVVREDV